MCMITVLSPLNIENEPFNYKYLKNAHHFNSDGAGFAYVANVDTPKAKVKVVKSNDFGIGKFIKLLRRYRRANPDSIFMIHQRNATKGVVTKQNCHPFIVGDIAMAHNGTIYKFGLGPNSPKSDSVAFAEMLEELPKDWYTKDGYYTLLQDYIGTTINRAAFLLPSNEFRTIGTDKWENFSDDVLFSNDYYKKEIPTVKKEKESENVYEEDLKCECGSTDIHMSSVSGDKHYCENCYIKLQNEEKYDDFYSRCNICGERILTTPAEKSSLICNECYSTKVLEYTP